MHIQHPLSYPELRNTSAPISYVRMSCITFRFSYLCPPDSSCFHHVVLPAVSLHASVFISFRPHISYLHVSPSWHSHWLIIHPCMPVTLKSRPCIYQLDFPTSLSNLESLVAITPGRPEQETKAKWLKAIQGITRTCTAVYTDGTRAEGVVAAGFITDNGAAAYGETTPEGGIYLGTCATVPDGERAVLTQGLL